MESIRVLSDVKILSESLGELPGAVTEPVLVVVSGLPGTGKSYFSRKLAEKVGFLILESDALRKALFPSPTYSSIESYRLFRAIRLLIEKLLKRGISLILDATNLSEQSRKQFYNIADRLNVRLVLVRVEAPAEVVWQRMQSRPGDPEDRSDADWTVYQQMLSSVDEIKRDHYVVDTSQDITQVIDEITGDIGLQLNMV